ncbi:MAG: recombination protein O N-terminal domain-containing protein [Alistipes sp.]|jgi:DNA repair protein RecO (recombination protein O)|nr:recombination protein O N-terminal domain-containing protein [Alistipes sp.]
MKTYKARGIVLHAIKYGESGAIAYVLTDVGGRRSYIVPGVRSKRGHGNKGALLQPMFLIEFEGLENRLSEMHRFRELRSAVTLRSVPFDVRKSTVSLFMAEMLYRLVREMEPNSPLFDFVWDAVCALDGMEEATGVANFHLWFMVGLSRHLGFFPGNEWSAGSWFDVREGLFVGHEPWHGNCFSRDNAALLGTLMTAQAGELAAIPLNRTRRVDFLNSMLSHFGYHLDAIKDIRSVDILREVF